MIEIDGSRGEGGGQILRTALSLACHLGAPFRIRNIRRNRPRPGLAPQHLTVVRALASICGARVTGDRTGSTELSFSPGKIVPGEYRFDVGTAGSALLVLQALLPPLLFGSGEALLRISGGTHVPFSPCFEYADRIFLPALRSIGADVRLAIESYGFYPKGGGRIRAEVRPCRGLAGLRTPQRGALLRIGGLSGACRLPLSIAERQRDAAARRLRSLPGPETIPRDVDTTAPVGPAPGTFLFLEAVYAGGKAGFSALGAVGKPAEAVGREAADALLSHHGAEGALDPHLADQLIPYLALSEERSSFTTSRITRHLLTNLETVRLFHRFRFEVEGTEGTPGTVTIGADLLSFPRGRIDP